MQGPASSFSSSSSVVNAPVNAAIVTAIVNVTGRRCRWKSWGEVVEEELAESAAQRVVVTRLVQVARHRLEVGPGRYCSKSPQHVCQLSFVELDATQWMF